MKREESDTVLRYTPDGHWTDAIKVYSYTPTPWKKTDIEINWSCYGPVSIEDAEAFMSAFQVAVYDAKRLHAEQSTSKDSVAAVYAKVEDVYGEDSAKFMSNRLPRTGMAPIDMIATEDGQQAVLIVLDQIQNGVYA